MTWEYYIYNYIYIPAGKESKSSGADIPKNWLLIRYAFSANRVISHKGHHGQHKLLLLNSIVKKHLRQKSTFMLFCQAVDCDIVHIVLQSLQHSGLPDHLTLTLGVQYFPNESGCTTDSHKTIEDEKTNKILCQHIFWTPTQKWRGHSSEGERAFDYTRTYFIFIIQSLIADIIISKNKWFNQSSIYSRTWMHQRKQNSKSRQKSFQNNFI